MLRIVRSLGAGGNPSGTGVWHLRVERARQGRSRVSEKDCPRSGERSASALRGAKGSLLGTFNPLCAGLVIGSLA